MYTIAKTTKGRKQLREAREQYRREYAKALDRDDQAAMECFSKCMKRIDEVMLAAKLERCEMRMVVRSDDFTGSFYIATKEGRIVKLRLRETFEHINRKGWPSAIWAELHCGHRISAELRMQPWDCDYNCYWYSIWTRSGAKIAEELKEVKEATNDEDACPTDRVLYA